MNYSKILTLLCVFGALLLSNLTASADVAIGPIKVHPTDAKDVNSDKAKLLEIKDIKTESKSSLRVFVKLDSNAEQELDENSEIEVCAYHNNPAGSALYFNEKIKCKDGVMKGFMTVPVYGESMRIVVWNINLKPKDYNIVFTGRPS